MADPRADAHFCAMPVFLIGFMCSGKTRIGRELAGRMGWHHVDVDRAIEQRIGPITPWFQRHGEEPFRKLENEVLRGMLGADRTVVSTGGGTPMHGNNMDRMLKAGTVVFLDVPIEELMERIARTGGDRPLLFGLQGDALRVRVEDLLRGRLPVYLRAGMRVRASGDPLTIAARIQQALEAEDVPSGQDK